MDRDTPDTMPTERDANARLIVRAVNSYDALVEACEAVVQVSDEWTENDDATAVLEWFNDAAKQARAALALDKDDPIDP